METNNIKDKYKERSEEISRTIYEYNKMSKDGATCEERGMFLIHRQREIEEKYGLSCSYEFLYPDMMGPIPDTYEEWKEKLEKRSEQTLKDYILETYGASGLEELEKKFEENNINIKL